jgi:hypothetical protein
MRDPDTPRDAAPNVRRKGQCDQLHRGERFVPGQSNAQRGRYRQPVKTLAVVGVIALLLALTVISMRLIRRVPAAETAKASELLDGLGTWHRWQVVYAVTRGRPVRNRRLAPAAVALARLRQGDSGRLDRIRRRLVAFGVFCLAASIAIFVYDDGLHRPGHGFLRAGSVFYTGVCALLLPSFGGRRRRRARAAETANAPLLPAAPRPATSAD